MTADKTAIGARLRELRERPPYWSRQEMARRLRAAADPHTRARMPHVESLSHMIKEWERGRYTPGHRFPNYQALYAHAFETDVQKLFRGGDEPQCHLGIGEIRGAVQIVNGVGAGLYEVAHSTGDADIVPEELQRQTVQAWRLRQSTDYRTLGGLLAPLLVNTRAAVDAAQDEHERVRLTHTYVHAHNAASSLLKRLDAPELAAIAADRALRAARLVDDDALVGAATLRLANVFLSAGRYQQSVDTAANGANALTPFMSSSPTITATWGALLLTAAIGAALRGEGPAETYEFLGQAKVASTLLAHEYTGLHAIFGPANLAIHRVQAATELGHPYEALRRAESIDLDAIPATLRERRSTLLLDMARSHRALGDHRTAARTLLDAERLAPQEIRYSNTARDLITGLLRSPAGTDMEFRTLSERMRIET